MVPIDQFQLQIRAKNVTNLTKASPLVTTNTNDVLDLSIAEGSSISGLQDKNEKQNISSSEYTNENEHLSINISIVKHY